MAGICDHWRSQGLIHDTCEGPCAVLANRVEAVSALALHPIGNNDVLLDWTDAKGKLEEARGPRGESDDRQPCGSAASAPASAARSTPASLIGASPHCRPPLPSPAVAVARWFAQTTNPIKHYTLVLASLSPRAPTGSDAWCAAVRARAHRLAATLRAASPTRRTTRRRSASSQHRHRSLCGRRGQNRQRAWAR